MIIFSELKTTDFPELCVASRSFDQIKAAFLG